MANFSKVTILQSRPSPKSYFGNCWSRSIYKQNALSIAQQSPCQWCTHHEML